MRSILIEGETWERYEVLRARDKQLRRNLCRILKEMQRTAPVRVIGKPEQLEHDLQRLWSRRLSQKDRVIYRFDEYTIYLFAICGHYDDR
jgi:toxin YoeB